MRGMDEPQRQEPLRSEKSILRAAVKAIILAAAATVISIRLNQFLWRLLPLRWGLRCLGFFGQWILLI